MADYPMVLGDPYTVDGVEYAPADTASYDEVGHATADAGDAQGVTIAHKTLPIPSYVEITALDTGRTILARVERRGPMTSTRLVALSPAAAAQLQTQEGTPVRVRRVNAPEIDRAELRAGRAASARMDTPGSLLAVLRRKLPEGGATSLAASDPGPAPTVLAAKTPAPGTSTTRATAPEPGTAFDRAFGSTREANDSYPLRPVSAVPLTVGSSSAAQAPARSAPPASSGRAANEVSTSSAGDFVVQAAAFSSEANANRAAGALGGFVTQTGRFYRVRTGPYTSRGQAEEALAKVRAAGYSDARVSTAG